jgi:lycopene beta-cyclase
MRYFGFLARFVVVPLLILRLMIWIDKRRGRELPEEMQSWPEEVILLGHAAVAVTYTTIWDNYLVASNVWGYDPELVTGHTIGYVPIEEYTFFVLQPLLTGSWMQYLARRIPTDDQPYNDNAAPRLIFTGALGILWLASTYKLLQGEPHNKYLTLILSWALPPIMLQTAFGGDILWRKRALLAASILSSTAYLGLADSRAIGAGTWHINPQYTRGVDVIPNLPMEELLFFFLTNVLLAFGVTLVSAKESQRRLPPGLQQRYFDFKRRVLAIGSGARRTQ